MVAFSMDEAIESRIEYLASLPSEREAWIEVAHECWLLEPPTAEAVTARASRLFDFRRGRWDDQVGRGSDANERHSCPHSRPLLLGRG